MKKVWTKVRSIDWIPVVGFGGVGLMAIGAIVFALAGTLSVFGYYHAADVAFKVTMAFMAPGAILVIGLSLVGIVGAALLALQGKSLEQEEAKISTEPVDTGSN